MVHMRGAGGEGRLLGSSRRGLGKLGLGFQELSGLLLLQEGGVVVDGGRGGGGGNGRDRFDRGKGRELGRSSENGATSGLVEKFAHTRERGLERGHGFGEGGKMTNKGVQLDRGGRGDGRVQLREAQRVVGLRLGRQSSGEGRLFHRERAKTLGEDGRQVDVHVHLVHWESRSRSKG